LRGPGPRLVVANHPTLIDVIAIIACMPQADCVVKGAHWRNPLMRAIVRGADYIPNTDGDGLVSTCVERLREGRSLLLFPEGTRSPEGRLGAFHRGAAHIALRSGCDVLPVTIRCDPPAFTKGARWHDVPDRIIELTVEVRDPFPVPERLPSLPETPLAARRMTVALRELYEGLLRGGRPEHAEA
jgi:1-acyl-sn-glycerol-3-phosphate acyltransferase